MFLQAFITDFAKETFEMPTNAYVFILGLLLPAYSFTGLDGPAHLSEETTDASMAAPRLGFRVTQPCHLPRAPLSPLSPPLLLLGQS